MPGVELFVLVALLFAVGGIALAVVGIRGYRSAGRFEQEAVRAPGLVVDMHTSFLDGRSADFPIVRFEVAGRPVETRLMHGARPAPAQVGDQVTVLYDPKKPSRAALPGMDRSGRFTSGIVIAVGFAGAALGLTLGAGALVVLSL